MKNYAVLEGMKRHQKTVLDDAFNKGYDQGYQDGKLDGEAENIEKLEKKLDDEKKAEYDRGFKEGKEAAEDDMCKYYNKHFNDVVNSSNDDAYQRGYKDGMQNPSSIGYQHGYEAGLQHGQELRVKEAECAEACGMKRAWQAVRKIMYMSLFDLDELFPGWDVEHIIEKLSAKEVIEKVEAWEKKQEQNKASCKNCAHGSVKPGKYYDCQILSCDAVPCVIEDNHCDKYEEKQEHSDIVPEPPLVDCNECAKFQVDCSGFGSMKSHCTAFKKKQDAPDINDGNIKVGDEVTYNIGNVMVVTRVYSESRSADLLRYDGTVEQQPLEILTPTGKHYDIQALFDAIKPSKPEEGGE